jgi:hypothetical protein
VTLDVESVMLVVIGTFFVLGGAWSAISPRKALESNYAWDRRWTRVFTLGRYDPKPRPLTDRAVKGQAVAGVIFIVAGLPILFVGIGRILS